MSQVGRYDFEIRWIRPDGSWVDIADRVLELGALNQAIGDPSELFAARTGDISATIDDDDDFLVDELQPSAGNPRTDRWEIDLFRNGVRWFRGSVLDKSITFDEDERTASFTIVGQRHQLDETGAVAIARTFPESLALDPGYGANPGERFLVLNAGNVSIQRGDLLELDDYRQTFTVRGYAPNSPSAGRSTIELEEALDERTSFPPGTAVRVVTPFPRNSNMKNVAEALFAAAGITDYQVEIAEGFSSEIFRSPFNSTGLETFGSMRGLAWSQLGSLGQLRAVMSYDNGAESAIRAATTLESGFLAGTGSGFFPPPDPFAGGSNPDLRGIYLRGPYFYPYDWGPNLTGGDIDAPLDWSQQFLRRFDHYRITPYYRSTTYDVFQRRYAGWWTNPGASQGVLFELVAYQSVEAEFVPRPQGIGAVPTLVPNWRQGGRYGYVYLRKWLTFDRGVTWNLDASFSGRDVNGNPVSGRHEFLVVPEPATPIGGDSWEGGGGRSFIFLPGVGTSSRDAIDPEVDWSISAIPDFGFGGTLYITSPRDEINEPAVWRVPLTGGQAGVDFTQSAFPVSPYVQPMHFSAGSCKALRLDDSSNETALFWRNLEPSYQQSAILIDRDIWNGVSFVGPSTLAGMPIGGRGFNFRELRWNGEPTNPKVATTFRTHRSAGETRATVPTDKGVGWLVLGMKDWNVNNAVHEIEASEAIGPGVSLEEWVSRFNPTGSNTSQNERPVDLDFMALWKLPNGTKVFVGNSGERLFVLSNEPTGFVSYFNFEGLSASEALNEMAFLTNSTWKVEPAASDGHPRGLFLPRSQIVVAQHYLEDLFDNKFIAGLPPGGLVYDKKLRRSYEHSYNFVRITNGLDEDDPDAIIATAGDPSFEQDALELELRLLESPGYARIIAESLVRYYGGYIDVREATEINLRYKLGGGGSTTVVHVVVAADSNGRLLARSNLAFRYNGLIQQQMFWEVSALGGVPAFARIYRTPVSTTSGGYGFVAQVAWSLGTYVDVFAAPGDGSQVPTIDVLQPRQAGEVIVLDDGRLYSPGDEIKIVDLYRTPDPDDPSLPPWFTVEQVDVEPADDLIKLTVYQKEIS